MFGAVAVGCGGGDAHGEDRGVHARWWVAPQGELKSNQAYATFHTGCSKDWGSGSASPGIPQNNLS